MGKIRISGIVEESIVDGPGIRYVVFTQGCKHNCKECHNPETHSLIGGYVVEIDDIINEIRKNSLLSGITLSGGEPFLQKDASLEIIKKVKKLGLNVIVYTGYTIEELVKDDKSMEILKNIDILVDGKFEIEKKSPLLKFRGSSNQRMIYMKEFFENNSVK